MSSDRSSNTGRPLKPTLASTRAARAPLTPRIAGSNATPPARASGAKTPSTVRSEPPRVTPRVKQQSVTPGSGALSPGNVTPRSSMRKSRVDSPQSTPTQDETPSAPRPRSTIATTNTSAERNGNVGGLGVGVMQQERLRVGRPRSLVSDDGSGRAASPLIRSPGLFNQHQPSSDESIDGRFFHASEVQKQDSAPKKPETKKTPAFFYANGQQEPRTNQSPQAASPVLSAVSDSRASGPWLRADGASNPSRSPPALSPALSTLSSTSPFFPSSAVAQQKARSPSPSKDSIHLSYRKGASQIFGTRPTPRSTEAHADLQVVKEERRGSLDRSSVFTPHRKSPSLSSLDSGNSHQSRRRSATTADPFPTSSPLTQEVKSSTPPRGRQVATGLPSIDTSLESPSASAHLIVESTMSPRKSVSELAADARRERKVLDLEISNSSLLAINSSLEREVRRQKAELKRFRRLSRAGRFSVNPIERAARFSEGLSTLGEDDAETQEYSAFGPPSGFTDVYDDFSDEDGEESVTSGGEPLSPTAQGDRLADDEKRLRVDLEKHKELLVQSQMMNQSLKRCTYATEAMIKDAKKALHYHVRVSDVKLGGRILTLREDDDDDADEDEGREEDVEIEDETLHADDAAKGFLDVWQGVGTSSLDVGSEAGDHDSGIEVDKLPPPQAAPTLGPSIESSLLDSGRPPD